MYIENKEYEEWYLQNNGFTNITYEQCFNQENGEYDTMFMRNQYKYWKNVIKKGSDLTNE